MHIEENETWFDEIKFQSDEWQRPYHYLVNFKQNCNDIPVFDRRNNQDDCEQFLSVLIR